MSLDKVNGSMILDTDGQSFSEKLGNLSGKTEGIFSVGEPQYKAMFTADGNWIRAIETAVADANAAGGGIVFLPPGTYETVNKGTGFTFPAVNNVTIQGAGAGLTIIKRTGASINTRFLTIESGSDIVIRGIGFDNNGLQRYGGANIYSANRVLIENCYAYDSALSSEWNNYDHYWFVIQQSTDVVFRNNISEDIELVEVNECQRVRISNNTSIRAAGTTAIAVASVVDGVTFSDYVIENNIIVDPRKASIYVQNESGGANNAKFERFKIVNNEIVRNTINSTAGSIRIGNFTGVASTGNVYDDFVISRNYIYNNPSLGRSIAEISINHTQTAPVFKRFYILDNTIVNGGAVDNVIDLRKLSKSNVSGNRLYGITGIGIQFHTFDNSVIGRNIVEATTTAYILANSQGYNKIQNNIVLGSPTTSFDKTGAVATDKFAINDGTASSSTTDIKDLLVSLGLITDSGATPLNLDGGALTAGNVAVGALGDRTDRNITLVGGAVSGSLLIDMSPLGSDVKSTIRLNGDSYRIERPANSSSIKNYSGGSHEWYSAGTRVGYVNGTSFNIVGELDHDGTKVGFYNATPITKQTGVAVDVAAIHQALVNLGLISS